MIGTTVVKSFLIKLTIFFKMIGIKIIDVLLLFLTPLLPLVFLVGIGIFIDTLVGRWAAKKVAVKNRINVDSFVTSRKTKNGVIRKMIIYNGVLITGSIIDNILVGDLIQYYFTITPENYVFTKIICGGLLLLEYDSIDEKVKIVTSVSITQRIKKFIRRAKSLINVGKDFNETHNKE